MWHFNTDQHMTGVATGFRPLDDLTGGWQPTDLIIVAARPSIGKSAFALQTLLHGTRPDGGVNGFLASLEMSGEQLADRAISKLGRINAMHIRRPKLMEEQEWASAPAAAQQLTKHLLYVDDASSLSVKRGATQVPSATLFLDGRPAFSVKTLAHVTFCTINGLLGCPSIRCANSRSLEVLHLTLETAVSGRFLDCHRLRVGGRPRCPCFSRRACIRAYSFMGIVVKIFFHAWRDAMSCILHLIWGPTCSGKTEVAVALAEQTGWPVIALDRVQCCPEMSTCSGRPLPAELRATRRIYLASRAVREGIIAADEAHALLVDLVDRRSAAGGVILEGGSISLINRMILDPYWANDWQWRSHRLLLGECADFLDRALRRVEKMLRTGMGRPSLLEELVALWPDPALRPTIEDVDGYRYSIRFARQWNVPVGQLLSIGDEMKQRLIHGIAEEYLGHAQWQERDLLTLPANWQAQDVSMGGSKSGLHHRL